ncbi:MAG TPA: ComEC/Rec2 family competence protein [Candidatus Acidoferrum sp.]|nr:ComEC/Rec2 family competence protein [Candidatus Acidoferrum sp.]
MKRPLLPVALCFAGGIVLGQWAHPPLAALFGAALAAGLAALTWERGRIFLLGALLLLAGWTDLERHTAAVSPQDLRLLLGAAPEDVKLRGVICAPPTPRIFERGAREFWHTGTLLRATEIWRGGQWQPAWGKVIAGTSGVLASNFCNGRSVEVSGIIRPLRGALADGLMDPRRYYRLQEVYFQLQADSTNAWLALGPAEGVPLPERFSAWARRTLALGLPQEDQAQRLMWTLALDWKAPLTENVEEPFLRAGTFHIFAVDGLRIGLLAAIGIGLLRALQIPRAVCGLVVVPVIWFYAGLTGWPASAVRAAIMMSIVIGGWAVNRPGDLINSLFAAALIILVWDPQQLFQAGFQLSFLIVLCIGLLALPMRRFLYARFFAPDKFVADEVRPAWQVWGEALRRRGIDAFVMSLAAFLGSLPLTAYYFHLCSPVGVPANMVVVPLTALALMSCMASLLTGGWFPGLAVLFNHAAWFWMKCIMAASQWSAHWAVGNWHVAAPRPITFVWYYAVLLAVFTGWIFRVRRKGLVWAGLVLLSALWLADREEQRGTARLDVLALRGAPALFAAGWGTNRDLLADCGNAESAGGIVKPFLCAQGVNRLEDFCLTTGYQQSVGGADIVLTNFRPAAVFAGPARVRSPAYRRVAAELARTPGLRRTVQDGDGLDGWSVLYPGAEDQFAAAADEVSPALQRNIHGHSVVLLSALAREGQILLMNRHPELRAEIVVAGLPSRDEPLMEPLLDMLRPKLIIIADSELPATRGAPAKLRERLAQRRDARVLYCREAGSLTLLIRRAGWEVRDASGATQ